MGIRIDGNTDLINAADGTLTVEGLSINTSGMVTATGGVKVGTAATIHSTGQLNIGVAHTIFANGNATHSGIVTAAAFHGNGANITGISTLNITGYAAGGGGAGVGGTWAVGTAGIHTTKNVGVNTTAVKGTAVGAATSEGALQAHGSVSVFDGFIMTDKQIDKHLTLPEDKNGILIGPVTVATGIGITIESGATLLIA